MAVNYHEGETDPSRFRVWWNSSSLQDISVPPYRQYLTGSSWHQQQQQFIHSSCQVLWCAHCSKSYHKKVKVQERIAVNGFPSHGYVTSLAIWDHTALPATRHKWTRPAFENLMCCCVWQCTVWVKNKPPWGFVAIFPKRLGIFQPNFTWQFCIPISAGSLFYHISQSCKCQ